MLWNCSVVISIIRDRISFYFGLNSVRRRVTWWKITCSVPCKIKYVYYYSYIYAHAQYIIFLTRKRLSNGSSELLRVRRWTSVFEPLGFYINILFINRNILRDVIVRILNNGVHLHIPTISTRVKQSETAGVYVKYEYTSFFLITKKIKHFINLFRTRKIIITTLIYENIMFYSSEVIVYSH